MISREDFGLDICLCKDFEEAKEVSSMYKLPRKSLTIQEWIFGWDHKTSYVYNFFKNGQDKAKEIWRRNYGMHNEYQNLGTISLHKIQKDLGIRQPVVDPRVRHLTQDYQVSSEVIENLLNHFVESYKEDGPYKLYSNNC